VELVVREGERWHLQEDRVREAEFQGDHH
jgi:hypothetical protein